MGLPILHDVGDKELDELLGLAESGPTPRLQPTVEEALAAQPFDASQPQRVRRADGTEEVLAPSAPVTPGSDISDDELDELMGLVGEDDQASATETLEPEPLQVRPPPEVPEGHPDFVGPREPPRTLYEQAVRTANLPVRGTRNFLRGVVDTAALIADATVGGPIAAIKGFLDVPDPNFSEMVEPVSEFLRPGRLRNQTALEKTIEFGTEEGLGAVTGFKIAKANRIKRIAKAGKTPGGVVEIIGEKMARTNVEKLAAVEASLAATATGARVGASEVAEATGVLDPETAELAAVLTVYMGPGALPFVRGIREAWASRRVFQRAQQSRRLSERVVAEELTRVFRDEPAALQHYLRSYADMVAAGIPEDKLPALGALTNNPELLALERSTRQLAARPGGAGLTLQQEAVRRAEVSNRIADLVNNPQSLEVGGRTLTPTPASGKGGEELRRAARQAKERIDETQRQILGGNDTLEDLDEALKVRIDEEVGRLSGGPRFKEETDEALTRLIREEDETVNAAVERRFEFIRSEGARFTVPGSAGVVQDMQATLDARALKVEGDVHPALAALLNDEAMVNGTATFSDLIAKRQRISKALRDPSLRQGLTANSEVQADLLRDARNLIDDAIMDAEHGEFSQLFRDTNDFIFEWKERSARRRVEKIQRAGRTGEDTLVEIGRKFDEFMATDNDGVASEKMRELLRLFGGQEGRRAESIRFPQGRPTPAEIQEEVKGLKIQRGNLTRAREAALAEGDSGRAASLNLNIKATESRIAALDPPTRLRSEVAPPIEDIPESTEGIELIGRRMRNELFAFATQGGNGTRVNRKAVEAWIANHQQQIEIYSRANPRFGKEIRDVRKLVADMDTRLNTAKTNKRELEQIEQQYNQSSLAKTLKADPEEELDAILDSKNPREGIRILLEDIGDDKAAREGLQTLLLSHLTRRSAGESQIAMSALTKRADPLADPKAMDAWLSRYGDIVDMVFDNPDQRQVLALLARVQGVNVSGALGQATANLGTKELDQARQVVSSLVSKAYAHRRGQVGLSFIVTERFARVLNNRLADASVETVQRVLAEALTPRGAKRLMEAARDESLKKLERLLARDLIGVPAGTAPGRILDDDETPTQRARSVANVVRPTGGPGTSISR